MAALDKETLVAGLGGLGLSPVFLKHAFLALTVQVRYHAGGATSCPH